MQVQQPSSLIRMTSNMNSGCDNSRATRTHLHLLMLLLLLSSCIGMGATAVVGGAARHQQVEQGIRNLKCPEECFCETEDSSAQSLTTTCTNGGLEMIPMDGIDSAVDTLIIGGPRNQLTIGPIFQSITNVRVIRITNSNVPALGRNSFLGLIKLRLLDVSHNVIQQIDEKEFHGLGSLRELDLSHNRILRMPSGAFHFLQNLTRLNLAHNKLGELVQRQFLSLGRLAELDLSGNPLKRLHASGVFEDIRGLKVLKLRGCLLENVSMELYQILPQLRELDLGNNAIMDLPQDAFMNLRKLQVLRLDGNLLTVVRDNSFLEQRSLRALDLSRNQLSGLEAMAFNGLKDLLQLDISYNSLTILNNTMETLSKSLRVFNVSGNGNLNPSSLHTALKSLPMLHTLALADFGKMPSKHIISAIPAIRALNVSGNVGSVVDLGILFALDHLSILDLSRNQLNGIPEKVAILLAGIEDVRLEENPLICDKCHMGAIINRSEVLPWPRMPSCFVPESLRDVSVAELDVMSLDWCIRDHPVSASTSSASEIIRHGQPIFWSIIIGGVTMLFGLVFLIIVVLYTRHRAKYYTHEDNMNDLLHKKRKNSGESITTNNNNQSEEDSGQDHEHCSLKIPLEQEVSLGYPCVVEDYILPLSPPQPPSLLRSTAQLPPPVTHSTFGK